MFILNVLLLLSKLNRYVQVLEGSFLFYVSYIYTYNILTIALYYYIILFSYHFISRTQRKLSCRVLDGCLFIYNFLLFFRKLVNQWKLKLKKRTDNLYLFCSKFRKMDILCFRNKYFIYYLSILSLLILIKSSLPIIQLFVTTLYLFIFNFCNNNVFLYNLNDDKTNIVFNTI